jgi:hypothetical protein
MVHPTEPAVLEMSAADIASQAARSARTRSARSRQINDAPA